MWGHFCVGPGLWVEGRAKAPIVYKDGTKWPSLFRKAYLETAVWQHGVAVYCGGYVPHFRWIPVGEIVSVGLCKVSKPWVAGKHAMADRGFLAPHVDGVQLFLTEGRCMEIGSGDPGRLAATIEGLLAKRVPNA